MESKSKYDAVLLQPPPGDLTGPYPALSYLKSYAAGRGYRVKVKDLGIEALHYLSNADRTARMLADVRRRCLQMEARTALDVSAQRQYNRLLTALPASGQPEWFSNTFMLFRQPDAFYDHRRYRLARNALNAFFDLLSAAHYPTILTAAEYPTATMLKTMDAVLAHQDAALNPYVHYYEHVLFPQIEDLKPPLIGISMVFANQSVQALVLGRMIKSRWPDTHVVLGGAYLSQWAMTADDAQVAQLLSCADSIACGEGEQVFTDLLACVSSGRRPENLPNLIHKHRETQDPIRPTDLNYTDIADQPPPDFSDLDLNAYLIPQTVIPYCISRGCYWGRCVFCQNRYGDHRIRRYQTVPVEKAVAEMTALADQYGSNQINFSNDVIDPGYLKKLSQAMLDSGRTFCWHTDLRAEKVYDASTCRLMAGAGLKSVAIGFESGCQKTLDAMDKGKQVDNIARVLKNLYTAGVATQAMGIFGMPGESEADGAETVHFLEANSEYISYYVMGLLMVLPGSRMHSEPQAHGVDAISYDHSPLKTPEPVWVSATRMSIASVNRLYGRLSGMEQVYAIDEYPYVGGLSTNHGFLYYTLGPDILKRLRQEEQSRLSHVGRLLGAMGAAADTRKFKRLVPRKILPYDIRQSRYPLHRLAGEPDEGMAAKEIDASTQRIFMLLPDDHRQGPVPIGTGELSLLNRIDGRRTLWSVLKKTDNAQMNGALSFIWYLVRSGVLELSGGAD